MTQSYLEDKKKNSLFPKINVDKNSVLDNKMKTSYNVRYETPEKKLMKFTGTNYDRKPLFLKSTLNY